MEFWTSTVAAPTRSAAFAKQAEAEGWDGMLVVDSQNLSGDSAFPEERTTDRSKQWAGPTNRWPQPSAFAKSPHDPQPNALA